MKETLLNIKGYIHPIPIILVDNFNALLLPRLSRVERSTKKKSMAKHQNETIP